MKTHTLFCLVLTIITCTVFIWKAESALSQLIGMITLIASIAVVGDNIVRRLNT